MYEFVVVEEVVDIDKFFEFFVDMDFDVVDIELFVG